MTTTRYRLRIGQRDVLLPDGVSMIGRSDDCALLLDDALLSREHAKIVVAGGQAVLHDLGSRNGTYINGNRVEEPVLLRDGDVIRVGHTDLHLYALVRRAARSSARARTVGFDTRVDSAPGGGVAADLALRMIQMGRLKEAEKLLKTRASQLAAQDPPLPVKNLMSQTVQEGLLGMAEQTMDGAWIHRLLKLHVHCDWFMTEAVQKRTDRLLRAIGHLEGDGLASYLGMWASRAAELSPTQTQQIQRLQDLAKRVSSDSVSPLP